MLLWCISRTCRQNCGLMSFKTCQLSQRMPLRAKTNYGKDHYKTLNLSRDCTQADIRLAYLKLSKDLHPDINKSSDHHESFVLLNDAYSVLSKPHMRHLYDIELRQKQCISPSMEKNIFYDDTIWVMQNKAHTAYDEKSYYGVKGIKRVSNGTVAALVIVIAVIGSSVYFFMARLSVRLSKEKQDIRHEVDSQIYTDIRRFAAASTREEQVERFLQASTSRTRST